MPHAARRERPAGLGGELADVERADSLDQPLAAFLLELAPGGVGCLSEPHVALVRVVQPEDPGRAVTRRSVVPELELLQQDDRSRTLAERACRGDPGDPRPDDDDVRVGSHVSHHRTALGTDAACEDRHVDVDLEALFRPGTAHASGWRRMPAVAAEAMIATSHPLASAAGLEAFRQAATPSTPRLRPPQC